MQTTILVALTQQMERGFNFSTYLLVALFSWQMGNNLHASFCGMLSVSYNCCHFVATVFIQLYTGIPAQIGVLF